MTQRLVLEKKFKECLQHCILISFEKKQEWLKKLPTIPDFLLERTIAAISGKNQTIDSYIKVALDHDLEQKYLTKIKGKVQSFQNQALNMQQEANVQKAEQDLLEEINKI